MRTAPVGGYAGAVEIVLNLDDDLAAVLFEEADRIGVSLPEVVVRILRSRAAKMADTAPLPPLPTFRSGRMLVDISDREALFEIFDSD